MMQGTFISAVPDTVPVGLWLHGGTFEPGEGTFSPYKDTIHQNETDEPASISHLDVSISTVGKMTCAGIDAMQTMLGHAIKSLYSTLENRSPQQVAANCEYVDQLFEQIGDIAQSSCMGGLNLLKSNKSYLRLPYLSAGVRSEGTTNSWLIVGMSIATVRETVEPEGHERFVGLFALSHESGSSVNWIPSLGLALAKAELEQEATLRFAWQEVGEVLPKLERLYQQLELQRDQILKFVELVEADLLMLDEKVRLVQ
jgi:hypothetical protein